jgi:hypothetical protein
MNEVASLQNFAEDPPLAAFTVPDGDPPAAGAEPAPHAQSVRHAPATAADRA